MAIYIVFEQIDGRVYRLLNTEEAQAHALAQKPGKVVAKAKKAAPQPKGRVFTTAQREAQAKRMRAYWKAKKAKT